ncbi:hypothetical protein GCM10009814_29400 [Lapillicoccus jejuensis]
MRDPMVVMVTIFPLVCFPRDRHPEGKPRAGTPPAGVVTASSPRTATACEKTVGLSAGTPTCPVGVVVATASD